MRRGIAASGDRAFVIPQQAYDRRQIKDFAAAVFYGLSGKLVDVMHEFAQRSTAVYIDLGYWGRHDGGRFEGYHKLVANARHPTRYFQRRPQDADRFARFHVELKPWRADGRHVLVCGMSDKAALAEGIQPHAWELATIARLRQLTRRPIVYRPKPNWRGASPIPGSSFSQGNDLEHDLRDCWAVVTHHSNAAVDALLAGVPTFCESGVASVLSSGDLAQIHAPAYPNGREQWAADLAYCQWNVEEMTSGAAWRHLRAEGIVPCT